MAIIKAKPTSPGRRFVQTIKSDGLHNGRPIKSLVKGLKRSGGRNNKGRMTTRHIGGGHKKLYRNIDFRRNKDDISAVVERIEYDPNRSAHIALLLYKDGERKYIVAPKKLKQGDQVVSGENSPIENGNTLPLSNIPVGTVVHCIEMKPGKGAQLARSAGTSAQLLAKEGNYATLRLKSGEVRKIDSRSMATIGVLSNPDQKNIKMVAMNPIDHPHGGGEGKTSGGRDPVSPWGLPTKGFKTRSNRTTDKFIVRRRRKRK